ncbi:MAG: hypothetical protein Q7J85_05760 [Bacillota bacterium]|nr:hypothetical protein [Bacillota bacterium]
MVAILNHAILVTTMQISQLIWNENIIEHLARHNVLTEEVEEVCFDQPLIVKSKQTVKGVNQAYYALGQTVAGRYLFIMIVYFKQGRAMVVTARDMDQAERKYYQRRY